MCRPSIGIVGSGCVASFVAANLASTGCAVKLVTDDAERLREARVVTLDGTELSLEAVTVTGSFDALEGVDACLVAVRSHETDEVARRISSAIGGGRPIVSFQNGLSSVGRLREVFGPTVTAGVFTHNFVRDDRGRVVQATRGKVFAGNLNGSAGRSMVELRALFREAGLGLQLRDDIDDVIAGELLINLSNGICATTGLGIAACLEDVDARWCFAACLEEGLSVMRRAGLRPARVSTLGPDLLLKGLALPSGWVKWMARLLVHVDGRARSSTLRHLEDRERTEIDDQNGPVATVAEQIGTTAPRNQLVANLVHDQEHDARAGHSATFTSPAELKNLIERTASRSPEAAVVLSSDPDGILVTTSRMPTAIDEIRKLGKTGHRVFATDSFIASPGSHSRYVEASRVTASPRFETDRFLDEIGALVREKHIETVLPSFEEVFYLARNIDRLPSANYFFPSFEVLAQLHDKGKIIALAREIGVDTPRAATVTTHDDMRAAAGSLGGFLAKPVFSRGGVEICTNRGPLAGAVAIESCDVSAEHPWVVEEFLEGEEVCTFGVAQHGVLTAHVAYVHPRRIEHAGGIVFESVDDRESLRAVQRFVEATGYHGQISFDFIRTQRGLKVIECNPRPTAGVHVMSAALFEEALLDDRGSKLRVVPSGVRRKYGVALVRDAILNWREAHEDLRYLSSGAEDVVTELGDLAPALCQILSYGHVLAFRQNHAASARKNTKLMAAYFEDICWNGDALDPSMMKDRAPEKRAA